MNSWWWTYSLVVQGLVGQPIGPMFDPRSQTWWCMLVTPAVRGQRQANPWGMLADQHRHIGKPKANDRLCQMTKWTPPVKQHQSLTSGLHMDVCSHPDYTACLHPGLSSINNISGDFTPNLSITFTQKKKTKMTPPIKQHLKLTLGLWMFFNRLSLFKRSAHSSKISLPLLKWKPFLMPWLAHMGYFS